MTTTRQIARTTIHHVALEDRPPVARFDFAGGEMACDWTGCLYWRDEDLMVVSDLHLEKGASLAARGRLIPPYDTKATLARLADRIGYWQPRRVVSLGDSFHTADASERMPKTYRDLLAEAMAGRDWIWITGNHDPLPPSGLGGTSCGELAIGPVTFRHEPDPDCGTPEVSGHLHPIARIVRRGKSVRRRCFACDGRRMIMPSFGAYTGGLNIRDKTYDGLFDDANLHAHLLGRARIYTIAGDLLV